MVVAIWRRNKMLQQQQKEHTVYRSKVKECQLSFRNNNAGKVKAPPVWLVMTGWQQMLHREHVADRRFQFGRPTTKGQTFINQQSKGPRPTFVVGKTVNTWTYKSIGQYT
ncbi:unnamed protein product [Ceratitis capitata]|uniref:(Mediterranean fruit fly) hypothetical protein n=1 Tax=Ceratitis capitata TaxID=7213 RepID=A0A811U079_CERCA|nr:unnamed protein product [Ceratitis capitata]